MGEKPKIDEEFTISELWHHAKMLFRILVAIALDLLFLWGWKKITKVFQDEPAPDAKPGENHFQFEVVKFIFEYSIFAVVCLFIITDILRVLYKSINNLKAVFGVASPASKISEQSESAPNKIKEEAKTEMDADDTSTKPKKLKPKDGRSVQLPVDDPGMGRGLYDNGPLEPAMEMKPKEPSDTD